MKILVVGCNGQLGMDMTRCAAEEGRDVVGMDLPQLDITDRQNTMEIARTVRPDTIVNCAAYTAVDECESKPEAAFAVNRDGLGNLGRAAHEIGATVVHFSTDYVFDGSSRTPYRETDAPNPTSVYGKSKLEGEAELAKECAQHLIVRIAWLYGVSGSNFVKTILRAAKNCRNLGKPLKVVNDQHGSPTWTADVCRQVLALLDTKEYGIFHCTSESACTWYAFGAHILERSSSGARLLPCTTSEMPRPAPRPMYSVLENVRLKALGINLMAHWRDAFDRFWNMHGRDVMADRESQ